MDETTRRRVRQTEYNTVHGVIPQSIKKEIIDVMEGARSDQGSLKTGKYDGDAVAKEVADYLLMPLKQRKAQLRKMERRMRQYAENLEFEAATRLRDKMQSLQDADLR